MEIFPLPVGYLQTNCYVVGTGNKRAVVIDPGAGAQVILDLLEKKDLTPDYILLTHGHFDHTGAVKKILEKYPQAKTAIGAEDAELLTGGGDTGAGLPRLPAEDWFQPDILLTDGDSVQSGDLVFKVLHTPGHTKGGVCYLCGGVLFSGDTLFAEEIGRCDLYGGSFGTMLKSLWRLDGLEGDFRVLPGHGEETTLAHERDYNRYVRQAREGTGLLDEDFY